MNPLLNGTSWGELPGRELKIPYFMTPEWKETERKIEEAAAARVAAAVGRERRKLRRAEQQRKNFRIGAAVTVGVFAFLVLAINIVEILA